MTSGPAVTGRSASRPRKRDTIDTGYQGQGSPTSVCHFDSNLDGLTRSTPLAWSEVVTDIEVSPGFRRLTWCRAFGPGLAIVRFGSLNIAIADDPKGPGP